MISSDGGVGRGQQLGGRHVRQPPRAWTTWSPIVDYNKLQSLATVEATLGLEPLDDKFRAFGWAVHEIDGHDHDALDDALSTSPWQPGRPSVLIAHTTKGEGVSFMENQVSSHYSRTDDEQLALALSELGELVMRNAFIDELAGPGRDERDDRAGRRRPGLLRGRAVRRDRFPDRFINAGVAEQNMTGLAAGMASEGFHVFTYSIANFPTFRCAEQIRNDVAYHRLPVTVVAVGGGLAYGALGYSHHAVQDYALIRTMPT